ncbi:MAG: FixH family protein [Vicinamibacterales bacterium]
MRPGGVTPGAWRAGQGAVALLAAGLSSGCTRAAIDRPPLDVAWTLSPAAAVVGPATLTVTLRGPAGDAVRTATVHLEGHMSHPGMAPIVAAAQERAAGVYELPFAFTMAGDWTLIVSVVLPGGAQVERRITVANVRPSG